MVYQATSFADSKMNDIDNDDSDMDDDLRRAIKISLLDINDNGNDVSSAQCMYIYIRNFLLLFYLEFFDIDVCFL